MPSLSRFFKALGWPPTSEIGPPINAVLPVSTPDTTFDWVSAGNNSGVNSGILATQSVLATLTVPEDGFYEIDASAVYSMTPAQAVKRIEFRISQPPPGGAVYFINFGWAGQPAAAVQGVTNPVYLCKRMYLRKNWLVAWILLEAQVAGDSTGASLAMRQLLIP